MKLIDKYLLRTLFVPLAYCLLSFILLYVVFDLFNHMGDFMEAQTPATQVIRFYIYLVPSVLFIIAPISLLLAVLYALSTLTKNNELTAMRASGISILRLMGPFIIVGLLSSLAVGVIYETIAPQSAYWTHVFLRSEKKKDDVSVHLASMLGFVNDPANRDWLIGEFDTRSAEMRNITVTQTRPDGTKEQTQARQGNWLDGRWWFLEVVRQEYDHEGNPRGRVQFDARREMREFNETPADFLNEIKDPLENPDYVTSNEILKFIETHRLSPEARARLMVNFHNRLAMPWTCLIVTLIGIPFGAQSGRKGAFIGILSAILLFFAFFFLMQVSTALGKKQVIEPILAAWLPNALFFSLSLILIHRMR
jgi:lipopolysaccharide export system permease protein